MADDDKQKMPAGMAGITSYSDVNPEKVSIRPEHVLVIIGVVVLLEAALWIMF